MSYNFSTITPHSLSRSKVLQSDIRIHQMHFQDRGVGIVLEVDVVAHVELDFLRLAVSHKGIVARVWKALTLPHCQFRAVPAELPLR
jgi:hypothetical protein